MGRAIVTAPSGPPIGAAFPELAEEGVREGVQQQEEADRYRDRLFKYIPAEVVTLYLGLSAIVASAKDVPHVLNWLIFVAGIVATPYYLWFGQNVRAPLQLIVSTLAFGVWVFALGGPFADIDGYKHVYGAVLLPLFTFFVAAIPPRR
jgi:hypothetical protein